MFAPYYKKITSITSMVNNFADYLNQSHFDQQLEGYTFISDEYNLKEVGFLVSDSDLGTGIFNDEYLHNYSFYQDITISKVPNYLININAEIKIVLLDNQDQTLTFKSNIEAKNNYNCTHTLIYDNDNSDIHLVNCNNCLYSYHDCHEKLYENQENLGHKVCCEYCNLNILEPHNLSIVSGGNRCLDCDFFESTTFSYTSNNDGKSHMLHSGSISKKEICMGIEGTDGNFYCAKCGQNINGISFNSIIPYKKDNEIK